MYLLMLQDNVTVTDSEASSILFPKKITYISFNFMSQTSSIYGHNCKLK